MTELDSRFLEAFPTWLRTLGDDARALAALVEGTGPEPSRRAAATALNYLFKSLDLIPDGIEDLGFIDDAFVLRVSAAIAVAGGASDGTLERLGTDAALIGEFLGPDYARLEAYVGSLGKGAVRGRTVDDIVTDRAIANELVREVKSWAESYREPTFQRDAKNLVKLKSFLGAKLP